VNDFHEYASWGSYVYSWPSKFQMVFWPHTYSSSLYICRECHYAAWMCDFKNLTPESVAKVQKAVSGISGLPKVNKYEEVPMSQRLSVAEHVYQALDKDDVFWSQFYRVQGYHLAAEKKPEEAKQARSKARDLLNKLAGDPKQAAKKKEYLVSLAAMQHFLGDDASSLETLSKAKTEVFADGKDAAGYNQYLNQLVDEYVLKIKSKSVPEDINH